jgi:hypothetical protein
MVGDFDGLETVVMEPELPDVSPGGSPCLSSKGSLGLPSEITLNYA